MAGHRWLTADFVLFDGLIATPSGTRVADPLHVLVGDDVLRRHLRTRERSTAGEQPQGSDAIALHETEQLYGRLKLALRTHRHTTRT